MRKLFMIVVLTSLSFLGGCDVVELPEENARKNETLSYLLDNGCNYCFGTHNLDSGRVECTLSIESTETLIHIQSNLATLGWSLDMYGTKGELIFYRFTKDMKSSGCRLCVKCRHNLLSVIMD